MFRVMFDNSVNTLHADQKDPKPNKATNRTSSKVLGLELKGVTNLTSKHRRNQRFYISN